MSKLDIVAEGGYGFVSANYSTTYNLWTAKWGESSHSIGIGPLAKKGIVGASNSSLSLGGSKKTQFYGPELNLAIGVGIRLKFGLTIAKK